MLGALLFALCSALAGATEGETRARWHCEPATVEVGEPFDLVLELLHPAGVSGRELSAGELLLDESWIVLAEDSVHSTPLPDGGQLTRRTWRVASLEPGERAMDETLSSMPLSERVTRIQVGEARVSVRGLLAEGEDAPRPLREFPDGFAGSEEAAESLRGLLWLGLALGLLAGGAGWLAWRRRRERRGQSESRATPLERLGALEANLEGTGGRTGCFELTRLLREAGDGARAKPREGLTDEEWLAELSLSLEIPRGVVTELATVFERAARVKYAGEAPTPWALQEIFARARAALETLGGRGAAA